MINSFQRYENKYLLDESVLQKVLAGLTEHMEPDRNCSADLSYGIYNLYFDTEHDDIIRRSLDKPYYKEKLRLRSYRVPQGLDDRVYLELKKKIGGVVCKRRAEMTLREAYGFAAGGPVPFAPDYLSRQVMDEIAYFVQCNRLKPKVAINYQRMAFFSRDERDFRITFDCNIQTRRHNLGLEHGAGGRSLLPPHQYLMELKIPGAVPLWLARILSENGVYSTSFSKYGAEYQRYLRESAAKVLDIPRNSGLPDFYPDDAYCMNL